jgi:hypothetical protein
MQISGAHVKAAKVVFAFSMVLLLAAGAALGQGRSQSAPGQTKDKSHKPGSSSGSSSGNSSPGSSAAVSSSSRAGESGIASPVTATTPTSAPAAAANAVVYYGSWLDDVSIVEPGKVWVGLATGYWRGSGSRQIDAPVASVAVGINSRTHAGGSLSFYHFRTVDGVSENGFGNISLYGKFVLLAPASTSKGIGLAVTPLFEFSPGVDDPLGWALPVNVEIHRGNLRVYGSSGYFSRGSIFGTVGADFPITDRISLMGSFGQSYARGGANQTSVGIGAFATLNATTGVYAGLGQTLTPAETPHGLSFAGGMSFFLPDPRTP